MQVERLHQCAPSLSTAALTRALWLEGGGLATDYKLTDFDSSYSMFCFNEDRGHLYVLLDMAHIIWGMVGVGVAMVGSSPCKEPDLRAELHPTNRSCVVPSLKRKCCHLKHLLSKSFLKASVAWVLFGLDITPTVSKTAQLQARLLWPALY